MTMRGRTTSTAAAVFVAAGLLLGADAHGQGQAPPTRAVMRGLVIDDANDRPIAGATVEIEALKLSYVTDSSGIFRISLIPPGRYIVAVRRLGFSPLTSVVNFVANDTLEFDFALVKQVTALPEVAVTAPAPVAPKLREFEERRRAGFGRFLTPAELDKDKDRRLSEVIAKLPGPRIMRGSGNYGWIASSVGSGAIQRRFALSPMDIARGADPKQCYAAVMLDGNIVYAGRSGEMLFDVNLLGTNTIAAIEYYRDAASTPSKFNVRGGETCGLVVIWTK